MSPLVGLCRFGYVVTTLLVVPTKDCPRVGTLMGPIEEDLREKFFPEIFGGMILTLTSGKS